MEETGITILGILFFMMGYLVGAYARHLTTGEVPPTQVVVEAPVVATEEEPIKKKRIVNQPRIHTEFLKLKGEFDYKSFTTGWLMGQLEDTYYGDIK